MESVCAGNRTVGSNPTLSAKYPVKSISYTGFLDKTPGDNPAGTLGRVAPVVQMQLFPAAPTLPRRPDSARTGRFWATGAGLWRGWQGAALAGRITKARSRPAIRPVSEFLKSHPVDGPACLVLDVRLPGQSGLNFQRELAAANRKSQSSSSRDTVTSGCRCRR